MRLSLDKYYTPEELAIRLIDKTFEIIGPSNITDIIEPSAGSGAFSKHMKCRAIDIQPENDDIECGDFLELDIPYKKGRLIIGNPPFGVRLNIARRFFNKSTEIADYIAFILPISQYNNKKSLYKFNLIYSEDIGTHIYTDRKLHCCFNIYKRPENGINKHKIKRIPGIVIYRDDKKGYKDIQDYDIRMCHWGTNAGKILQENEHYAGEYKIKITHHKKEEIIDLIKNFDWKSYIKCKNISTPSMYKHHILEVIEGNIKNL